MTLYLLNSKLNPEENQGPKKIQTLQLMMDSKHHDHGGRILMLPWLAHGHVSPFLELARRLVSINKNFQVFICSTPVNLNPFRETTKNNHSSPIQFVDLHLPSTPELPPDHHSTKNLPPHLMPALKTAFDGGKHSFHGILRELKPNLLIYDFLQPWAAVVAQEQSIPALLFLTCSAATSAFLYHYTKNPDDFEDEYPIPEFNFPKKMRQEIIQFMDDVSNGLTNRERYIQCIQNSNSFVLVKTWNEIEKKHADYLSELAKKEVIPVGPLVRKPQRNDDDSVFMDWLDQRKPSSVLFVSFGTEYFLSKEEIGYGLEQSMLSFIWVVRFHGTANNTSLQDVLPDGRFLERVAETGMIVEGWAPQAKILSHGSIGGFVSHCGWSSTLESVAIGVPIIAVPMHLDQPLNARLVVEIGVGMEVPRENGKLRREEVARVIREFMVEEKGEQVRKKVIEMKQKADDHHRHQEIDDHVVKKLLQLIEK